MAKDPQIFVGHILTEIDVIKRIAQSHNLHSLIEDDVAYRASIYSIQCISEAVRNLPTDWIDEFPKIPWQDIKSIGNWTRNQYHALDDQLIWKVITEDLVPFEAVVNELKLRTGKN